jgi:hypothetical protein
MDYRVVNLRHSKQKVVFCHDPLQWIKYGHPSCFDILDDFVPLCL